MTLAACPIYKLFYNFPTFLSFDGLVGFDRSRFWSTTAVWHLPWWHLLTVLPLVFILWFSSSFSIWRTVSLDSDRSHFWSTIAVWHLHWWQLHTVLLGIYFMVFLQFFHLTDWYFGFGQEPFLANNCSVKLASCSTRYLFSGFPTVSPLAGLFFWIRTGSISGQRNKQWWH